MCHALGELRVVGGGLHHGFGPEHDPSAIPSCGEDNDGIPTAVVLEGACFAYKQWPSPERELLVRRLMRGLRSWIMAMERQAADPASPLLARAAFPESIDSTDGGRRFFIDYGHCRSDDPQLDTYVDTVHIPANPTWGDLYIRNKRSKDDIGHMLWAHCSGPAYRRTAIRRGCPRWTALGSRAGRREAVVGRGTSARIPERAAPYLLQA